MPTGTNETEVSWLVERLRLSVFFKNNPLPENMESWWNSMSIESEESVRKPLYRESGKFGNGQLVMSNQPLRIDWIYEPYKPSEQYQPFPNIGSWSDTVEAFSSRVENWLTNITEVKRLAFGTVLLCPSENRMDGYDRISRFLPDITIRNEGESDFFFQINRPRNSVTQLPDLKINRLSKWAVMLLQKIQFTLESGQQVISLPKTMQYANRLELDINTSPEYTNDLPNHLLPELFKELVSLAKEIAILGDIP